MDNFLAALRHTLRSMRSRNFRLYFIGQLISMVGTWMQTTAQMWLVYRLTHSSWLLGLVGFAGQAPYLFFGLFGGVAADRYDRRKMLIGTQTASLFQALILGVLTATNAVQVWHVFVLAVLLGAINVLDMPARQAFVVDLVDRPFLGNAIALNSFLVNASRMIGPAIAGVTVSLWGEGVAFLVNAVSFLAVIACLFMIWTPETPAASRTSIGDAWRHVKEGLAYAWSHSEMRAILLLLMALSLAGVPYMVLMPVFSDRILHGGANGLGLLMGATGVGALAGSVFLARREDTPGLAREACVSVIVFGVALVGFAYSRRMELSLALMLVAGWGMMTAFVACNTNLQLLTSNEMRGRVMSLFSMSFMGIAPLGSLGAGYVAEKIGEPWTVAVGGILSVLSGVWFLRQGLGAKPEPAGASKTAPRTVLGAAAAVIILGCALRARAEDAVSTPLRWEDCVALALRKNPDLAAALRSSQAGKATYYGSVNGLLPQITLTNQYTDGNSYNGFANSAAAAGAGLYHWQGQGTVSLNLFNASQIANVKSASASYRQSIANLRIASAGLRFSLRQAFSQVLFAEQNVEVSSIVFGMRDVEAQMVSLRYESGQESKGNMMRSKAQVLQAKADLDQARRNVRAARISLDRQLGLDDFSAVSVTGTLQAEGPPALPADLRALLADRPDVQLQEAVVYGARAAGAQARSALWPVLSANYSRTRLGGAEFPSNRYNWSWTGLLSYPLFGGGPTAAYFAVSAADRSLKQAEQNLRVARDQAVLELESSWTSFAGAVDQVAVQTALLESARQRNDEADISYASGLLTYNNWEIIASDRISQEHQALQARLNAVNARAAWEKSLGEPLGD